MYKLMHHQLLCIIREIHMTLNFYIFIGIAIIYRLTENYDTYQLPLLYFILNFTFFDGLLVIMSDKCKLKFYSSFICLFYNISKNHYSFSNYNIE